MAILSSNVEQPLEGGDNFSKTLGAGDSLLVKAGNRCRQGFLVNILKVQRNKTNS
ncbi:hypothetical protein Ga0451573_000732 [Peptococcaceae bacterium DYL19]|nr:hypothetical protein [Phosphitispora fastidiosa]